MIQLKTDPPENHVRIWILICLLLKITVSVEMFITNAVVLRRRIR
jgi:hypothetical protein